eukprot:TRINITY_DN4238_c0_g1_i2.p2 TRINITY_DN4238_c0_g1~~TRINITY_DN4238_c0_g1_i2.p2  ORF type:complete len:147 (-),score=35.07 TRINITY_DN4238_c0_g1_i2:89-529(-)
MTFLQPLAQMVKNTTFDNRDNLKKFTSVLLRWINVSELKPSRKDINHLMISRVTEEEPPQKKLKSANSPSALLCAPLASFSEVGANSPAVSDSDSDLPVALAPLCFIPNRYDDGLLSVEKSSILEAPLFGGGGNTTSFERKVKILY